MSTNDPLPARDLPRIHSTGLAADFLNRFNEPAMLLDLVPTDTTCREEFLAWTPCSYVEHFTRSRFSDRALVLEAYFQAPPGSREALGTVVAEMSRIIVATQVELRREPEPSAQVEIASEAAQRLRNLLVAAGAIIHGRRRSEIAGAQDEIDALFGQRQVS
jgi:hypothetical protein